MDGSKRPTKGPCDSMDVDHLPDAALLRIWSFLPTTGSLPGNLFQMELVCKKWRRLILSSESVGLWKYLVVSLPRWPHTLTYPMDSLYRWFRSHSCALTSLTIELTGKDGWSPVHAILGTVGLQLTSLRLYSDNEHEICFIEQDRAAWLSLVPNLRLLALEGVVDVTIQEACFPTGLTGLALNGCGLDGLSHIPSNIQNLSDLRSLSLQFMAPHSDLSDLVLLSSLQHVDLSSCALDEIPMQLTSLQRLTSLTMNYNTELGGKNSEKATESLALLFGLKRLEMRDSALPAIPSSLTSLTSLRTLLLGYNEFANPCIIPDGPYLSSLELLGISDTMSDPISSPEILTKPLKAAVNLQILRLNRNWGLNLTTEVVKSLLHNKPNFRRLEYSEDMASSLNINQLMKEYPNVAFVAID